MQGTVILNANYEYLNTISWQKAIKLIVKGKATVLKYTDRVVRAGKQIIQIPAVMQLIKLVRAIFRTHVPFSKRNVMVRDGFTCQYCGSIEELTIDHVLPISRGGKSTFENCVTACKPCNSRKTNKLPNETGFHLKKKPTCPTISEFIRFRSEKLGIISLLKELGVY
jgi:5-methylcytosine-specific restriction endonuclease McrA